jgi:hypothetical protein
VSSDRRQYRQHCLTHTLSLARTPSLSKSFSRTRTFSHSLSLSFSLAHSHSLPLPLTLTHTQRHKHATHFLTDSRNDLLRMFLSVSALVVNSQSSCGIRPNKSHPYRGSRAEERRGGGRERGGEEGGEGERGMSTKRVDERTRGRDRNHAY